jgi:hypothetical protein
VPGCPSDQWSGPELYDYICATNAALSSVAERLRDEQSLNGKFVLSVDTETLSAVLVEASAKAPLMHRSSLFQIINRLRVEHNCLPLAKPETPKKTASGGLHQNSVLLSRAQGRQRKVAKQMQLHTPKVERECRILLKYVKFHPTAH